MRQSSVRSLQTACNSIGMFLTDDDTFLYPSTSIDRRNELVRQWCLEHYNEKPSDAEWLVQADAADEAWRAVEAAELLGR